MVSNQKAKEIRWWKKQAKDKNLGASIREYYKQKLREAGEKVE